MEIIYVFSGKLSAKEFTAFTLVINNFLVFYVPNIATTETAVVFIGNSMEEKSPSSAKEYFKAGLVLTGLNWLITEIRYGVFARSIAGFYVKDSESLRLQA